MNQALLRALAAALCLALLPVTATSQGAEIAFGDVEQDPAQPVEVTAETLSVDQDDGTAIFTGDVLIVQGEMRLSAPTVEVFYDQAGDRIQRLKASGGVTLVSGDDSAEAESADYSVESGTILMQGDVLLVQGQSALTSDRMTVDTHDGTARMEGRVRTVLQSND
ncbi:lipopolysaccharide transport periplasmic protein LptA [Aquicoccus sp.]|uniref:lipopolysaccharide transport periplasmic protein LptA n=1 Tax=Aquicoccus sp. TaxID=2055851 RepID=UPI003568D4BA